MEIYIEFICIRNKICEGETVFLTDRLAKW